MNPKSAIEKGKRFEKHIAKCIAESGLDPNAGRQIGSGSGLNKGDIRSTIPFLIEAKNEANVPASLLNNFDQAKQQSAKGWAQREKWALVIRDPRTPENASEEYAIIDFHQFLDLIKKSQEPRITNENPDRSFSYALKRLVEACKAVDKYITK